ncbi:hypothetical protein BDV59DRAFT_200792 [Aspergillus ambiguus]|uniref:uncharacterized protein n=1 Tax=Aspergillus ambiguus TaxID=176160 RepID=UPI003CCE387B
MASLNSSRTNSVRSHAPDVSDLDTALPPMSSKQLVTTAASRRAVRGSESSIVMGSFRGNHKAAAALGYPPEAMPSVMARNASTHRRTGSTIKTVMRKIFTRKRRSQTDSLDDDFRFSQPQPQPHRLHKDPPTDGSLVFHNSFSSKHSTLLHDDPDNPTALRDTLDRLQARPPRRRRATLPSLIFSDGDDESRDALEAVVHDGSNTTHAYSDDPNDADYARRQMKRRSRSATALRGLARNHRMSPIQWRRRSLESYMTMTVASDSELSPRPPTRTTVASTPKPSTDPSVYEDTTRDKDDPDSNPADDDDDDDDDDTESIAVPTNVGTLVTAMQGDDTDDISLAQRLATLEVKMIDLEFAIARMQTGRPDLPSSTPTSDRLPKKPQPQPQPQPQPSQPPETKTHRRRPSTTPPSGTTTPSEDPAAADNRLSTATIRPSTTPAPMPTPTPTPARPRILHTPSMTSLNDGAGISVEQYSALVMLLRREQTARRTLESEVSTLREDVQQLQRLALGAAAGSGEPGSMLGTMYPIRSAESSEFLRLRSGLATDGPPSGRSSRSPYESSGSGSGSGGGDGDESRRRWAASRRVEGDINTR